MKSSSSPHGVPRPAVIRPNLILATCCLSLLLVTMDVTIVNVALPAIRRDLRASVSELQWSIDAYTLVMASFVMLAGATADRLGRRRTFQTGLVLFSLGSLLCSLAPTTSLLVVFRVVQALGGAMLNPVAMAIITNTFLDARERARAIGIWGAVLGVSMAVGPLLGGVLTETIGWRSIFWVNVPIGAVAIALTAYFIPESRAGKTRRVDAVGQALVVITLAVLASALIGGPHAGWHSLRTLGAFGVAFAAAVALIVYERQRIEPLIDLRFFRSLPLSVATITAILAFIAFSGTLFVNSLYLQEARELRASVAGLCLLPTALAMVVCSPLSGRLVGMGRARTSTVTAGAAMTFSALLLTPLTLHTSFVQLLIAYGSFGVSMGLVNAPITNAAVSGMPRAQAGVAAALASTSRQVGATLGVALAGSLLGGHAGFGPAFIQSTHAVWWMNVACGVSIMVLGVIATGERARRSVISVSGLLDPEPPRRSA